MYELLKEHGYFGFRQFGDVVVGLMDYLTTRGIVVGLTDVSYERRYCYQNRGEARKALETWDGSGHPPGNWIKVKGKWQGQPIDMLNPEWVES